MASAGQHLRADGAQAGPRHEARRAGQETTRGAARLAALAPASPVAQRSYRTDEAVTVRIGVTGEAANDTVINAAQG
ncbi:hypothetical protein SBBP1_110001 [Burkholderiales bacterium]|nr:hypothetical protein SBBP1_110001 [Burkholderiales bacterium]